MVIIKKSHNLINTRNNFDIDIDNITGTLFSKKKTYPIIMK
jgi:hypothetical protein